MYILNIKATLYTLFTILQDRLETFRIKSSVLVCETLLQTCEIIFN